MNAQKWEYRIEGFLSEDEMNRLGAEGWELVSAEGRSVFRRPKVEAPPSVDPLRRELFAEGNRAKPKK